MFGRAGAYRSEWERAEPKELDMATHAFTPPPTPASRPRLRDWLLSSFWVADAMLLAMLTFFFVVGDMRPWETTGLLVAIVVLAALWIGRLVIEHRHGANGARDLESRSARERRGF